MTPNPPLHGMFPDLAGAKAALTRAAESARRQAQLIGEGLIVVDSKQSPASDAMPTVEEEDQLIGPSQQPHSTANGKTD